MLKYCLLQITTNLNFTTKKWLNIGKARITKQQQQKINKNKKNYQCIHLRSIWALRGR